jgi:hypothetical protein
MKKSDLLIQLYGIHQSTALLESLNWDQKAFDEISIYVASRLAKPSIVNSTFDVSLISKIVVEVKEKWGAPASKIIEQMFNTEALKLNLLNSRSNDVN